MIPNQPMLVIMMAIIVSLIGIVALIGILFYLIYWTRDWILETRDRLIEALQYSAKLKDRVNALDGKGDITVTRYKNGEEVSK